MAGKVISHPTDQSMAQFRCTIDAEPLDRLLRLTCFRAAKPVAPLSLPEGPDYHARGCLVGRSQPTHSATAEAVGYPSRMDQTASCLGRTRTYDRRINNPELCQLSYEAMASPDALAHELRNRSPGCCELRYEQGGYSVVCL